jgi:hypothetical protein
MLRVEGRCWCAAFTCFMDASHIMIMHSGMHTSRSHALHLLSTTYAAALMRPSLTNLVRDRVRVSIRPSMGLRWPRCLR